MIYYFSATGNSRHVANRLAEAMHESVTPVLDVLGKGVAIRDQMILVYPNYCGGVPSVIREFLQKNIFQISKDAKRHPFFFLAALLQGDPMHSLIVRCATCYWLLAPEQRGQKGQNYGTVYA